MGMSIMSEPIRPDCDICGKPIGSRSWTQWKAGSEDAEHVAHTDCFEASAARGDEIV